MTARMVERWKRRFEELFEASTGWHANMLGSRFKRLLDNIKGKPQEVRTILRVIRYGRLNVSFESSPNMHLIGVVLIFSCGPEARKVCQPTGGKTGGNCSGSMQVIASGVKWSRCGGDVYVVMPHRLMLSPCLVQDRRVPIVVRGKDNVGKRLQFPVRKWTHWKPC